MGHDRKPAGPKDKNVPAAVLEYNHDMAMQGWLAFRPAVDKVGSR